MLAAAAGSAIVTRPCWPARPAHRTIGGVLSRARPLLLAALVTSACGSGSPAASPVTVPTLLTVDGMEPRACGVAPMSALTAQPGAEDEDSPEAAALREVLRTGIAGMSFPPQDGYVALDRTPEQVTFGRREGEVGIGAVVTVRRQDGAWGFGGSGGCGPIGWADGRRAAKVDTYTARPGSLVLHWTGGTCDDGAAPVVRVSEDGDVVSVLLVPPPRSTGDCDDAGTSESTPVALEAPVGDRRVQNVGFLPVRPVPSRAAYEADAAAQAAAYTAAEALCQAAATELGGTVEVVFPTDVAAVRDAVPQTRSSWQPVAGSTTAGHCYLETGEGTTWAAVTAPGVPTVVYDEAYDRDGLYVQLGG